MPRGAALRLCATAALLAGPFVLAFRSGGYFAQPRLWAGIGACALVVVAALAAARPLPRSGAARAAIAGLAGLTALTALSIAWAPLAGPAYADTQRLLLYLAALVAGVALLRPRALQRAVEPAMAAGSVIVIGYGMAGRLLPDVVDQSPSASAAGRLDQPLTYWNAVGAVAAFGLVLCVRVAGDAERPRWMRTAAAGACGLLGMGLYVTFSRGALAAAAAGLLVLVAVAPERGRLRTTALGAAAAALGAVAAAVLPGVASLEGDSLARDGAIGLVLLAAVTAAAAALAWRLAGRDPAEDAGARGAAAARRGRPAPARLVAAVLACVLAALVVAAIAAEERRPLTRSPATGATPARLTSFESHRYAYWRTAVRAFGDRPLQGIGSGSFSVRWLQEREFAEGARDAHSLYLETAAELGLAGLLALALLFGGGIAAARAVLRADPALAAGPLAGLAAWAAQAGIDWIWEMPAVTLPALLLLAALLARADDLAAPADG